MAAAFHAGWAEACLPGVANDDGDSKSGSRWNEPQDCAWPLDTDIVRHCSVSEVSAPCPR